MCIRDSNQYYPECSGSLYYGALIEGGTQPSDEPAATPEPTATPTPEPSPSA